MDENKIGQVLKDEGVVLKNEDLEVNYGAKGFTNCGGTAGCQLAIKDAGLNMDVTILDAATELGAGVRTYFGRSSYTFGPRRF